MARTVHYDYAAASKGLIAAVSGPRCPWSDIIGFLLCKVGGADVCVDLTHPGTEREGQECAARVNPAQQTSDNDSN